MTAKRTMKNAVVQGTGSPSVKVLAGRNGLSCRFVLPLLNDSNKPARRVRVRLLDGKGTVCGEASCGVLDPSAVQNVTVEVLDAEGLFARIAQGENLSVVVTSSLGGKPISMPFPKSLSVKLFIELMTGFEAQDGLGSVVYIPKAFRGVPGLLETYANGEHLPREIPWPRMPSRNIVESESKSGTVKVDLVSPAGVPNPTARLSFGDQAFRDIQHKVRYLCVVLDADVSNCEAIAQRGLQSLNRGNFVSAAQDLREIYDCIASAQEDRSDQRVTLIGHGHIDMNWLWTSWETLQCCHDTFRQVLTFMDEFPEFKYSQSQASTYEYIERIDPDMFRRIQEKVREGRWEILGGTVDEGDTNLSSGEALARSLLLGQRYFAEKFGRIARVSWCPDNFGHAAQLPQIMRLAGLKYFYGHRCQPYTGCSNWVAPDGSRLINYATPTYNGEVDNRLREAPAEFDPKHKSMMWIYGVGDHGGGPSRQDITRAIAMRDMPGFPKVRFGTAEEFFRSKEAQAEDYPTVKGEMQYIFEGCYTSIARIKEGNRRCENVLYAADMLAALMGLYGFPFPKDQLYDAWHKLTFNQFHDILCGSATHEANRESIALYDAAIATAEEVCFSGLRHLASRVAKKPNGGQPLVVFNSLGRARTDVVEAEVFSYLPPATAHLRHWGHFIRRPVNPIDLGDGPLASIKVEDEKGRPVTAQIVDGKLFPNGYRLKVQFVADAVPGCGIRTYYVSPEQPGHLPEDGIKVKDTTIETPLLKVVVDPKTGLLTRIFDKQRRKDVLRKNAGANVLKFCMEEPHGMSGWVIGTLKSSENLDKAESVKVVEHGPVRAVIEVVRKKDRSSFVQRIIVYKDLPRVDFELDACWFQLGNHEIGVPMLRVAFPLNVKNAEFVCDTPFAAVERPTTGQEVPAQKWTDLSGDEGGAALLNNSKYGHRCEGKTLEMTLLRASYDPDLYPDQGPHHIRYSLYPHAGNWDKASVDEQGISYNCPLLAIEATPSEKGQVRSGRSFLSLKPKNLFLSAIKKAEDGDFLIVRFCEGHGKKTQATLDFGRPVKSVTRVNLLEEPLVSPEPATAKGSKVNVSVKPHEIVTLRVSL